MVKMPACPEWGASTIDQEFPGFALRFAKANLVNWLCQESSFSSKIIGHVLGALMKPFRIFLFTLCLAAPLLAQNSSNNFQSNPTWWNKFLYLSSNAADPSPGPTHSVSVGA